MRSFDCYVNIKLIRYEKDDCGIISSSASCWFYDCYLNLLLQEQGYRGAEEN